MDELVNILNENGSMTGEKTSKFNAHKKGICHGISAVAIISDGKLLIQKRSTKKKDEANKWDLSSAGHINVGETPEDAAIREASEELGIKLEKDELKLIDTYLNKVKLKEDIYINHFTYLFVTQKNINIDDIIMQESEVSEIKFVNKAEYINMINNGDMVNAIKYCGKLLYYLEDVK